MMTAVLDRIAADDPAGGHFQVENRIVGGRKLVDQFLGGRAAVPNSRIAFLQNHHATALESGVVGLDGGGDDIGETHVRDEAAALVHLQQRFLPVLPFGDAHFAGQHAGFDADERNRFGQGEGGAHLFAVFPGLERGGVGNVFGALLRRAALVNRRQAKIARQAACGRARVHPGQLKRDQRQRQVLRPGDEPAVFRIQESRRDAAFVEVRQETGFCRRPFVRIAAAVGDQPGDRPARDPARSLHQHLQIRNGRQSAT